MKCPVCQQEMTGGYEHTFTPEHPIQWAQDALDGAALRRLREAMTATGDSMPWVEAVWDPTDIPGSPVHVFAGGADDSTSEPKVGGWGSTIAEAADKCREALRGR